MFCGIPRDELMLAADKKKLKGLKDVKKRDANTPSVDRIPLPFLHEHIKNERRLAFRDMQLKKFKLSAENPPSVCLYSILNANNGVCSASISENCSMFAIGYGNSLIKVHTLASEELKALKHGNELEELSKESENDDPSVEMYEEGSEKTKLIDLYGHSGPVNSVSFSCERRMLLSASRDSTMRLWNLEMRRNLVIYKAISPVWQAQFCNRGFYFAAATADQTVSLWSTEKIQPIRIFTEPMDDVTCLDFHPNCNYIIGGSDDHKIRIWDVLTSNCVQTYSGHNSPIRSVKVSLCGRYLYSISANGQLAVWDMLQQRLLSAFSFDESIDFNIPIVFSRDGSSLVIGFPHHGATFLNADAMCAQGSGSHKLQNFNHSNISEFINDSRSEASDYTLFSYRTKGTSILDCHFTRRNTVVAVGVFNQ